MALIRADRVKESSTSTGTGAFTLAGADSAYRTFASVCAVADTVYYAIAHKTSNEWEVGLGTYSATNTLTRTTVHASSNGNAAVIFSAGTKDVLLALTKTQLETYASLAGSETLTNKTISGASNTITNVSLSTGVTGTLPLANGGTGATTGTAAAANLVNSAPNDGQEYTLKSKKTSGAVSYYWVDSTGYAPTLDLLFAADKSLTAYKGSTPSFSRASTGTFFNSSGVLTSAAINTPRFNHTFNGTSWVSRGLLVEEQRTNSVKQSQDFGTTWLPFNLTVSTNTTASPDGAINADTMTGSAGTATKGVYQQGLPFIASSMTASVYAKKGTYDKFQICYGATDGTNYANFDLTNGTVGSYTGTASIVDVGNGWYRCIHSVSSLTAADIYFLLIDSASSGRAATTTATGSVNLWQAQAEVGAFATSAILTTSASVTRSADVCQITGSNFSGFWNGAEGSVAIEFDQLADATKMTNESYIYGFQNATDFEQFILRGQSSGIYYWRSVNNGNVEATAQISSLGTATVKHSACYKINDFASSFNGAAVTSDASSATPAPTALAIGFNSFSGSNRINGHIARLRYYPVRLPNATLQTLST